MFGNGKGGNSSTSGSHARTTPYNTRNNGKGGSYTSLNNPNEAFDGYETASSKRARRNEAKKSTYTPKNSQTVEPIFKKTLASAVEKSKTLWPSIMTLKKTIDDIQAELNTQLEGIRKQ